jgi:hypothetical protein
MALWHLLILICVALPVGTSLAAAQYAKVGFEGSVLAAAVGLVVGPCCGWVMWRTHKIVVSRLQPLLPSGDSLGKREWYFGGGFYLAKVLWLGFAGFLGFSLSLALSRALF